MLSSKDYFVCIGAQEAGTTDLYKCLAPHNKVLFSPLKEIHFFDAEYKKDFCGVWNQVYIDRLRQLIPTLDSTRLATDETALGLLDAHLDRIKMINDHDYYVHHFEKRVKAHHRLFGEVCPSYALLGPRGFSAMRNCFRSTKVVFLLRDPVARFWSRLNSLQRERTQANTVFNAKEQFYSELKSPEHIARSAYHATLQALEETFDDEEYRVLFYEDLVTMEATQQLSDFLGLDLGFEPVLKTIPTPVHDQELDKDQLTEAANQFEETYAFVDEYFQGHIPENWRISRSYAAL